MISSVSALWSQRRCFVIDDAKCWSVCFSPQPSPPNPLTPLSMGCTLGFFLHCSAWLHYFILEAQELRGVCVGQRTDSSPRSLLDPHHPFATNSYNPLPPLSRNYKGLGNLWVGFCLCFSGRNILTTSPLMPQPTICHLHFSKIKICHNASIMVQIVVTAIDSLKLIECHSFSFITVIDTKIRTYYWVSQSLMDWLGSIAVEFVCPKISAPF